MARGGNPPSLPPPFITLTPQPPGRMVLMIFGGCQERERITLSRFVELKKGLEIFKPLLSGNPCGSLPFALTAFSRRATDTTRRGGGGGVVVDGKGDELLLC